MSRADFVHLACPECGTNLRIKQTLTGRRVRCPNDACGKAVVVPAAAKETEGSIPGRAWLWIAPLAALPVLLAAGLGIVFMVLRGVEEPKNVQMAPPLPPRPWQHVEEAPKPVPPQPPPRDVDLPQEIHDLLAVPTDLVAPIPQDAERQAARFKEMLAYNEKTLRGAYDQVGHKDPRWDAAAHRALELAARSFSYAIDPPAPPEDIHAIADEAIKAGCDDPLILYLHARFGHAVNPGDPVETDRRYTKAALALKTSRYPAFRRIIALTRAALQRSVNFKADAEAVQQAGELADAAVNLLAASAAEDERNPDIDGHWTNTCQSAIQVHRTLCGDYKEAFDRVDKVLAKTPELEALRQRIKGDFFIHYAWEARGRGLANTVTLDGWAKFRERLPMARATLETAWKLQPQDSFAATRMLMVELGMPRGRQEMELWFDRAMKADNINREACGVKIEWLHPKWYGSFEELIAFGKACRATKNWRGGITLLSALPYFYVGQSLPEAQRKPFFRLPAVRDNVTEVYEEYLKHHPHDPAARTEYAIWNYMFDEHQEADNQFRQVGDKLTPPVWANRTWVTQIRDWVAKRRAEAEQKMREQMIEPK